MFLILTGDGFMVTHICRNLPSGTLEICAIRHISNIKLFFFFFLTNVGRKKVGHLPTHGDGMIPSAVHLRGVGSLNATR